MITIKSSVIEAIVTHAKEDLPNEACGYLAGKDGVITEFYKLTNVDHSPEHFSFDPAEQFNALRTARNNGLLILANYHSHPETPARPSQEDIKLAFDPNISYIIISLANNGVDVKSFRIQNASVAKEDIKVI